MRVQDITSTAGYAAQISRIDNHDTTHANLQHSLNELQQQHNRNDNFKLLNTIFHSRIQSPTPTAFTSSAEELLKTALSSSSYPEQPISYPNENKQCNKITTDGKRALNHQALIENDISNSSNTYRSFKETFHINKRFFNGHIGDFENANALEVTAAQPESNSIYIDNIKPKEKSNYSNKRKYCISPDMINNVLKSTEPETEITSNVGKQIYNKNTNELNLECNDNSYFLTEHDIGEDQSMIDFCTEESTKSSYENEDRDEPLTSSSSISLRSTRCSYFPRGIINPNYPGFQHLAHTLSEHFVGGSVPSDSYDSDISEYEMELSADSFDELPEEDALVQQQKKINMELNSNNNSINVNHNNNLIGKQEMNSNVLIEDTSLASIKRPQQTDAYISKIEDNLFSGGICNTSNIDINNLPDNLEVVLSFLDTPSANVQNIPKQQQEHGVKSNLLHTAVELNQHLQQNNSCATNFVTTANIAKAVATPDILIKNFNVEFRSKKETCPDLLRGVSPQFIRKHENIFPKKIDHATPECNNKCEQQLLEVPNCNANIMKRTGETLKDEIVYGISPVDNIIGDFGQEVEREFGLLVSGYKRLVDGCIDVSEEKFEYTLNVANKIKLTDAKLSGAKDQIDSQKFLTALSQFKNTESSNVNESSFSSQSNMVEVNGTSFVLLDENSSNGLDWCCNSTAKDTIHEDTKSKRQFNDGVNQKPKYQKSSYDDRQLPPVAIDYKRCQQNLRPSRKPNQNHEKYAGVTNQKTIRNHPKPSFGNRFLHNKRNGKYGKSQDSRKHDEEELHQYQQLISDKELILSNSRYAKLSSWGQYLKNSVNDRRGSQCSTELISPSTLDLFDAYKIGSDYDIETLQKHLKMAKEIEKKRRNDREEIRRRLAMGAEEKSNDWKSNTKASGYKSLQFSHVCEASSDTESHSSDSETCPKLSKMKQQNVIDMFGISSTDKTVLPFNGNSAHVSCSNNNRQQQPQQQRDLNLTQTNQRHQTQAQVEAVLHVSNEDMECDFFTKQARLQIEARMALAQAKGMAHMQMKIDRQNQSVSPITDIIRKSLDKVHVQMNPDKRRVSRQMLTEMNISQLQVLVNSLHTHIEELNESLVNFLMERDDLHMGQDSMLVDIEELTRYIGAKEHSAHYGKTSALSDRSN